MLEERGIATTVVALVRHQVESVRPPRAVMTPFQLGRPMGEPGDAAFQRRVLMQALSLLERTDGPVILEDFPDDPPNWRDTPDWRPSVALPMPAEWPTSADTWADLFEEELTRLDSAWMRSKIRFRRSSVGLAGQPPEEWPGHVADVLRGDMPIVMPHDTAALAMRFLADDIKALYSEAAQMSGDPPASRQIDEWFWRHTVAGRLLQSVRTIMMASDVPAVKTVGGRFIVPTPFVVG